MLFLLYRHPLYYPAYCLQLSRGFQCTELRKGLMYCPNELETDLINRLVGVQYALETLTKGKSWQDLLLLVREQHLSSEPFLIEYSKISAHFDRLPSRKLLGQIALNIGGEVDFTTPKIRYRLIETKDTYYFTKQIHKPNWRYPNYAQRPHPYSAALSTDLAALAINMIAKQGDRLVDPTCGSGTVIYEALCRGLKAWGYDQQWVWVNGARANLAHFGYQTHPLSTDGLLISKADAQDVEFESDVVIANLPYGRRVSATQSLLENILSNLKDRAKRFVFYSGEPLACFLQALGYQNIQSLNLTRHPPHYRFLSVADSPLKPDITVKAPSKLR